MLMRSVIVREGKEVHGQGPDTLLVGRRRGHLTLGWAGGADRSAGTCVAAQRAESDAGEISMARTAEIDESGPVDWTVVECSDSRSKMVIGDARRSSDRRRQPHIWVDPGAHMGRPI